MERPINQRVKFLAETKGYSQRSFAISLGLSSQSINLIFNDKNGVAAETLTKLVLTFPDVNAYWLLTGMGSPFTDANSAANNGGASIDAPQGVENEPKKKRRVKTYYQPPVEIFVFPILI